MTSWNLATPAGGPPGTNQVGAAGATLRKLNPDVVLLQGVQDWRMCTQLAESLGPTNYNVLLCSSFRDSRSGAASATQVALLAKSRAYFSWSESWRSPTNAETGFAFVALQFGPQRVGLFSVQAGDRPAGVAAPAARSRVDQLRAQVQTVKNWVTNQVGTFVIAGSFKSVDNLPGTATDKLLGLLEAAGFSSALAESTPDSILEASPARVQAKADGEDLLVQSTAFASRPQAVVADGFAHCLVTCDLELDPEEAVAARARQIAENQQQAARVAQAQAMKVLANGSHSGSAQPQSSTAKSSASPAPREPKAIGVGSVIPWWLPLGLGGLLGLSGFIWMLAGKTAARRAGGPSLLAYPENPKLAAAASYTVVIGPHSATNSNSHDIATPPATGPLINLDLAGSTRTQGAAWQPRALAAQQDSPTVALLRQGLLQNLSQWLKQALVRKLMLDRAHLLEAQQAATQKALNVDQRLARLELHIQHQNQSFEKRIESLTAELLAAKEENRELIRARIVQLKLEMEATRVRLAAQRKLAD